MGETRSPTSATLTQLMRFIRIGVASNVAGYALYLFVTAIGVPSKIAMSVLYMVGAALGFLGNRNYTFSYNESGGAALSRYAVTQAGGYCINLSMLYFLSDHWGLAHQVVQAAAVLVVAFYLFLMSKFFVFKLS